MGRPILSDFGSWRLPLFLYGAIGLAGAVALHLLVPRVSPSTAPGKSFPTYSIARFPPSYHSKTVLIDANSRADHYR
jgi:predicted MFS family arabinose efflux permease